MRKKSVKEYFMKKQIVMGRSLPELSDYCMNYALSYTGTVIYFSHTPNASQYFEKYDYFQEFTTIIPAHPIHLVAGEKYFYELAAASSEASPFIPHDLISFFTSGALQFFQNELPHMLLIFDGTSLGEENLRFPYLLWYLYHLHYNVIISVHNPSLTNLSDGYEDLFSGQYPPVTDSMVKEFSSKWNLTIIPSSNPTNTEKHNNIVQYNF